MKKFYLFFTSLFAISIVICFAQPLNNLASSDNDLIGIWSGVIKQPGYDEYSLRVEIKNSITDSTLNTNVAAVEYPSLNCSGYWNLAEIKDDRIKIIEILEDGNHDCINNGIVYLTYKDDHIKYDWHYPNGKWGASGLLYKE